MIGAAGRIRKRWDGQREGNAWMKDWGNRMNMGRKRGGRESRKNIRGSLILAWLLCWLFAGAVFAGEGNLSTTGDGGNLVLVDDGANLLSEDIERELLELAGELSADTGYQFMVITADDAGGRQAREYAEDYYMDHSVILDGAVYLIDMDNREIYIATSGQMRYYLTDSRVDRLLDDAFDCVSEGDYGEAFREMLEGTKDYLSRGIPDGTRLVDADTGEVTVYRRPKSVTALEAVMAVLAGLACGGALYAGIAARYRMKGGRGVSQSQNRSSLELTVSNDRFVNQFVTRRRIPKSPPPGSGGGGGHSSTVHTGSGGNSFGGGGRKF